MLLQASYVGEVAGPFTEAEDVHLVPGREVTDLIEGRDFVSAVWREWYTPTDIKNPHR
jgi:hypothetical protein